MAFVLLLATSLFLTKAATAQAQRTTFTNATLIDMRTGALYPATTVIVEGNHIAFVGPSASVTPPSDIDARGKYLMPGC